MIIWSIVLESDTSYPTVSSVLLIKELSHLLICVVYGY